MEFTSIYYQFFVHRVPVSLPPEETQDEAGQTALHWAIQYLHDVALSLKDHQIQDNLGRTPLHYVYMNPYCTLDLADHQIRDDDGYTALHHACGRAHPLLYRLRDHQIRDNRKRTPLHILCESAHQYTPLLKWHELQDDGGFTDQYIYKMRWWTFEDPPGRTPMDMIRKTGSHIHVLAKLRRLLRTLPVAYIRLVHGYT